jgi:hypothetical protein
VEQDATAVTWTLDDLVQAALEDERFPLDVRVHLEELPVPGVEKNLRKMQQLGILNGDALMALVGQAPIDPIGLMSALQKQLPGKWAFSAVDFSMFRVLSKSDKGEVVAALRVDLIQGDTIEGLARNQKNQLTLYKAVTVAPGNPDNEKIVNDLVNDTAMAARREQGQ